MNVSLDQLRAFVAAAATGSFTRAASNMCLSQPALTMRIRQLETNLRLRLFDRNTRSVQLTRVGRDLLPVFQRLLASFDAAIASANDLADKRNGVVRVATLPSFGATRMPEFISKFKKLYPRITFVLRDAVNSTVREMVKNEEVDLGIAHREQMPTELAYIDLFEDRMHAVYLADHPLAKIRSIKINAIARYPLVLMDQQTSVRTLVDQALLAAGQTVVPACEATYMSTAIAMVRSGLGVAVLPSTAIEPGFYPEVHSRPIQDRSLVRKICVLMRKNASLQPAAESFLELLTDEFRGKEG
jgi:DNA-binding transcriptional LysR family regulator